MQITPSLETRSEILSIPLDNFSRNERLSLYAKGAFALATVIAIYSISPPGFFRYYILTLVALLTVLGAYTLAIKVIRVEFDFVKNTVRQHFALPIFSSYRESALDRFEIVTSGWNSGRSGPAWISVSLSGRTGSLEIARFGPDAMFQDGAIRDHPEAKQLRSFLAARLKVRDIGVV